MRYFSMFSGIGTGEKGIERAFSVRQIQQADGNDGICRDAESSGGNGESEIRFAHCVGFSEIDRHAEAIYKYHYPDHRNYGDATGIICDGLPDFDFLIGGFPCQSFSIAGKRLGFEDTRGTLFFEIARILRDKRPSHFLLENVAGLLSHDNGNTFRVIVSTLTEMGYDTEWNVINSKDHGVPQNRERVFIVGHIRDRGCGQVFSVGDGDGGDSEEIRRERSLRGRNKTDAGCLTTRGINRFGRADLDNLIYPMHQTQIPIIGSTQNHQAWRNDGLSPTLTKAMGEGGGQTPMILASRGLPRDGRNEQQLEPRHDGLTNSLTSVEKDNLVIANCLTPDAYLTRGERNRDENGRAVLTSMHDRRIRRLTPRECEALQGLPPDYTKFGRYGDEIKEVSDTQRYKGLGNAFTVNVIEAIITRMLEKGCIE